MSSVLERVAKSVVRIWVIHDSESDKLVSVGTGFVCFDQEHVITAYHLLVNFRKVNLSSEATGKHSVAQVEKIFKQADLALLRVSSLGVVPLLIATDPPQPGSPVLLLGYAYGATKMESLTMNKIREIGGKNLREILNFENVRQIEELGFPDLSTEILNLEAHPAPGHSGGPVLDASGNVIGVIDGGIESGAGSVSWAIPSSQIELLKDQPPYTPMSEPDVHRVRLLFGADLRASEGSRVRVDGFELVERRRRTLQEIWHTSDDSLGLRQLINAMAMQMVMVNDLQFDVYEHPATGVSVVIPAGAVLTDAGGVLWASSPTGRFTILVRLDDLRRGYDWGATFEQYVMNFAGPGRWSIDPAWTYRQSIRRFDGALVMRKAAVGYPFAGGAKYVFQTLATRSNTALAIAAINHALTPPMMVSSEDMRLWAQLVLCVHLSQFSA